jgi:Plavaka transposase
VLLKPFTYNFPRADVHEILTPDLLHQVIKGTFKDHLVEWVMEWLIMENGEARANEILDDIDRRLVHSGCIIFLKQVVAD